MKYIVRFAGWIVHEGNSLKEAQEVYRGCGPYGTFREED